LHRSNHRIPIAGTISLGFTCNPTPTSNPLPITRHIEILLCFIPQKIDERDSRTTRPIYHPPNQPTTRTTRTIHDMKLTIALSLLIASSKTTASDAFVVPVLKSSRAVPVSTSSSSSSSWIVLKSTVEDEQVSSSPTKKAERLRFMKSDQFHRQGFKEVRNKVETTMGEQFESTLVKDLKASNYVVERDGVRVHLAKVCVDI
jgi:hypothetical protein